jgi:hypothetical protein
MDTSSKTKEHEWFHASQHWDEIKDFCRSFDRVRDLVCVSVFDASQKVKSMWESHGLKCASADILTDVQHDMSSRAGFFLILTLVLCLVPYGICILAPPCSLFVWLSSSMHKRCKGRELGDTRHYLVRLANILSENTAILIKAQLKFRHDTWCLSEQPKNSWMFKTPAWLSIAEGFFLRKTLTYQGLFGCAIEKGTHLLHNLPADHLIARKMTAKNRRRLQRRNSRLGYDVDKFYRKKNGSVSGTKHLSYTSVYPTKFVKAIFAQWEACSCTR